MSMTFLMASPPAASHDARPGLKLIQERIRRLGKTQRELAELWQVDPGNVSKFMASPEPYFPLERAKILAEFVELPLEEITKLVPVTSGTGGKPIGRPPGSARYQPDDEEAGVWGTIKQTVTPLGPDIIQFDKRLDVDGRAVFVITIKAETDLRTIQLGLRLTEAAQILAEQAAEVIASPELTKNRKG